MNVVNLYFFPGIPLRAGWIARIRCDDMSSHLDILFILVILAFTAQALILSTRLFLKKQKSKWPIRPRNLQLHFSSSKMCVATQGNHSKDLKIISSNCTSQFFDCFSQNAFIRNLLVIISSFFLSILSCWICGRGHLSFFQVTNSRCCRVSSDMVFTEQGAEERWWFAWVLMGSLNYQFRGDQKRCKYMVMLNEFPDNVALFWDWQYNLPLVCGNNHWVVVRTVGLQLTFSTGNWETFQSRYSLISE